MVWLIMMLALITAVIMENAAPAWHAAGQARLPAVLCVVIYYALNHTAGTALAAAFFGGIIADAVSGVPQGYSSLVFCALVMMIRRYREFVFVRQWLTHMAIGAIAAAVFNLAMYGLLAWRFETVRGMPSLWIGMKIMGAAGLGILLMPLFFTGLEILENMTGCRRAVGGDDFGVVDKI